VGRWSEWRRNVAFGRASRKGACPPMDGAERLRDEEWSEVVAAMVPGRRGAAWPAP